MPEPLLRVRNHHSPSCGDPPVFDSEAGNNYIGYFENRYGEQWIFTFDHESGKANLFGGDVGWTKYDVTGGQTCDLILNEEELTWLRACLMAVKGSA